MSNLPVTEFIQCPYCARKPHYRKLDRHITNYHHITHSGETKWWDRFTNEIGSIFTETKLVAHILGIILGIQIALQFLPPYENWIIYFTTIMITIGFVLGMVLRSLISTVFGR
jgi:hypothetical protein